MAQGLRKGYLNPDSGSFSRFAAQLESSSQKGGPFPHAQQTQIAFIGSNDLAVKADAVIRCPENDLGVAFDNGKAEVIRTGMLQGIGQGFLAETIENRFHINIQAAIKSHHAKLDVMARMIFDFFEVKIQRRF
jgi:hypothetical protein